MKPIIRMIVAFILAFGCVAGAQSKQLAADPWLSAADRLPSLAHHIEVELVIDATRIETYAPVIGRISIANRDNKPLTLTVRKDGAPYRLASLVARGDESFFRHHQWLRTSGPSSREITLAPGESTTGEILILFGGPPTGAPFAEPGEYRVKFGCQPDQHFAPVYTNVVELTVLTDDRGNAVFLDELSELVYSHYGWDRESVVRNNSEDYIPGMEILRKIIKVQKPHRVKPDNEKELRLIESLTDLLDRHPNSSYSGYIARYLGLLHIHAVMDEFSLGRHEVRENAEDPSLWDGTACRADPSYKKSLQYLTDADKSSVWPRATAIGNLAVLHMVAQEWDKANACLTTLRTKYAQSDGIQRANELERQMARYKSRLARREAAAP